MKLYYHALEAAAESWDIVKAMPDCQNLVGELLFRQIFTLAPAAISLYHFSDDLDCPQHSVPDMVYVMPSFKRHTKHVVETLEAALTMMLGDDMNDLALTLQLLGARHLEYGVLPHHYRTAETALLRALKTGLKERWSEELRKEWQAVFKFLAKAMTCGCECELEIVKEERPIKNRRIKLHTSSRRDEKFVLERLKASANACDSPRWNQTEYLKPFREFCVCPVNSGMVVKRRCTFDTSPKLPKRTSYIDDDDEDNPAEETKAAEPPLDSDSILVRSHRCHSPEPMKMGQSYT
jgi:hemoglobin-like flavoprotein